MSTTDATKKKVLYSILEYFNSLKSAGEANSDNLDTIVGLIEAEFGVSLDSSADFTDLSFSPTSLNTIFDSGVSSLDLKPYSDRLKEAKRNDKFDSFVEAVRRKGFFDGAEEGGVEYLNRQAKLIAKFQEKTASLTDNTSPVDKSEIEKQAEELKVQGNAAINGKKFLEAAVLYTKAIKLSPDGPNSHVYFSNRAAAYCHLNKYQEAVDDCQACLDLSPDYVKAYSRLGLSNFFLERYDEAVKAYERAVELEPDNKASQDSLRQAQNKLRKVSLSNNNNNVNDVPDLSALMGNNPSMKQAMDKIGGQAGLASLMNDPTMVIIRYN